MQTYPLHCEKFHDNYLKKLGGVAWKEAWLCQTDPHKVVFLLVESKLAITPEAHLRKLVHRRHLEEKNVNPFFLLLPF